MEFDQLIRRVAQMVYLGVSVAEIRDVLVTEGCTEEQAYLVFSAGRLLAERVEG